MNLLKTPKESSKELLYLEPGTTPIRYIVKFRRLMFLHYILNEKKDSLIHRCFDAQKRKPCTNDWIRSVYEDIEELKIMIDFEKIKINSKPFLENNW